MCVFGYNLLIVWCGKCCSQGKLIPKEIVASEGQALSHNLWSLILCTYERRGDCTCTSESWGEALKTPSCEIRAVKILLCCIPNFLIIVSNLNIPLIHMLNPPQPFTWGAEFSPFRAHMCLYSGNVICNHSFLRIFCYFSWVVLNNDMIKSISKTKK